MAIETTNLIIELELPEDFEATLERVIIDEIIKSKKKWRIKLTDEEFQTVLNNARTQARLKMTAIARLEWDLGRKLSLKIPYSKNQKVSLKENSRPREKLKFLLSKDGWSIDYDDTDQAVPLNELWAKQQEIILTWAKTAAFYGVGSYVR